MLTRRYSQNTINLSIEKNTSELFDWTTFIVTMCLVAIGLISIYSATIGTSNSTFFYKQLTAAIIGIPVMFVIMYLPERWLSNYALIIYVVLLGMLIFVFVLGKVVSGTKGWIDLGSFSIQPSEFAKVTTLLLVSKFLSTPGTDIKAIRDLGVALSIILLPAVLIGIQPDVGTATVVVVMLIGLMYWSGFDLYVLFLFVTFPVVFILSLLGTTYFITSVSIFSIISAAFRKKIFVTAISIGFIVAVGYFSPIIIENIMPHQKNRIETFLNPGSDPLKKGYNVIQSIMAVGSGGLIGKGFMQGTQTQLKYIPSSWTDFIFCVPSEEFGFIGGAIVIILIITLIMRALRIASESNSKFFSLISFGVATILLYHTLINIGMVIGLMPVMGIPLPFLSYGGSSLLLNFILVGLLLNAYRSYRKKTDEE